MKLRTKKRPDRYWITGLPEGNLRPYDTAAEARDDRRGVERFLELWEKPGFVTCDPPRKE